MGKVGKQLLIAGVVLGASSMMTLMSSNVSADTVVPAQESLATTQSLEGVKPTTPNADQKAPEEDTSETKQAFADRNLWTLGDSLSVGYNGSNVVDSWSVNLHKNMDFKTLYNNHAHSGSQISGTTQSNDPIHFTRTVSEVTADPDFKNESHPVVIIELGVNDLNYSANNLGFVQQRLVENIRTLRAANPNIVIYGVLPFADYLNGGFDTKHSGGYSYNDLVKALTDVYTGFGIPVLNWDNYDIDRSPAALGDKTVHPTAETYQKMSAIVAQFLEDHANVLTDGSEHDTNSDYTATHEGWQYLDDGTAQYVTKNADGKLEFASGIKKIDGVTYWFDPQTHKSGNQAGEVTQNGKTYYVGKDGRLQQHYVIVNGQANFYGDNDTYYKRHSDKSGYLQMGDGSWKWIENGRPYTGFRSYYGAYYHFVDGERQENQWVSQWGKKYYVGADGRSVQGKASKINGVAYDFGTDGTFYLRVGESGYLNTSDGWRWLENGELYTGFRMYYGAYYYFINGVRQENKWVKEWGNTYYVGADGRSVQGNAYMIDGVAYNFGTNGTFNLRGTSSGYVYDGSKYNGGYRWYEDGNLYTGFRYYTGTYYWFVDGVRQNAGWREAWGNKYYTDANGRAVQGWQTINGQRYFFGNDGTYYLRSADGSKFTGDIRDYNSNTNSNKSGYLYDGSQYNGGYRWYENGQLYTGFRFYMGTYYWLVDGVRQNEGWREAWGYKYYTDQTGRAVQGWQTIDAQRYFFGNDGTYYLR